LGKERRGEEKTFGISAHESKFVISLSLFNVVPDL
jgi:hypothetical protein